METTGAIGILEAGDSVLLVANWRVLSGERALCWDLPGGAVEASESLEDAVRREMLEETGRRVRVRDLAFVVERFGFRSDPADTRSRFFFFEVEEEEHVGPPLDTKIVAAEFHPVADLRSRCDRFYHDEMHAWFEGGRSRRYFLTRFGPGAAR